MATASDMPVVEINTAPDEATRIALTHAVLEMVAIMNGLPDPMRLSAITSLLISICAAFPEPATAFAMIGDNAARALRTITQSEGNA